MSERVVRVGLVGFGTVGSGVAKIILEDADSIAARTGVRLELACVVDIDTKYARPVKLPKGILTNNLDRLLKDDSIRIGVEMVGGTGTAKQIQLKMLKAGKDVVTANKALLAEYGPELYRAAHKNSRCIAFEASCAGGIPIISALRTGLVANNITAIYGIVNGTCNYILSNMTSKNEDFSEALKQAKSLNYAEADPTLDISGIDSAHKLAILGSLAFGCEITLDDISVEGIEEVSNDDIRYGSEMSYVLKLLAIGQKNRNDRISLRVHPSFIAKDNSLARVSGSFNAISIFGSAVGQVLVMNPKLGNTCCCTGGMNSNFEINPVVQPGKFRRVIRPGIVLWRGLCTGSFLWVKYPSDIICLVIAACPLDRSQIDTVTRARIRANVEPRSQFLNPIGEVIVPCIPACFDTDVS